MTDAELGKAFRELVQSITTAPTPVPVPVPTPVPTPPPVPTPTPSKTAFHCIHIEAPGRFGDNQPSKFGLKFELVRLLGIWSVPGHTAPADPTGWVSWGSIHTGPGKFNWAAFDAYVTAVKAWGVKGMLVPLHSPPAWAGPVTSSGANPSTASVTEFITAIINHANGFVVAVEGPNEFNVGNTNGFSSSGPQLAAIQKAMYQAAKAADPNVLILSPTITNAQNLPKDYPANWGVLPLKPFLDAGGAQWCDAIAVHVYPYAAANDPYAAQIDRVIQNTSALFAQYGHVLMPVWMTEGSVHGQNGQDSITDPVAAASYMKMYLDRMTANKVARMFWFCWDNHNASALWAQDANFGATPQQLTAFGQAMLDVRKAEGSA